MAAERAPPLAARQLLARSCDFPAKKPDMPMLAESPSLLITDDDPGFRETLQVVFEPLGLRTLQAGDGEEAIDIVHQEKVHVVLLDVHMPKLPGLETLRRLKEFRAMLPCIMLSAQLDDLIVEQARSAHAFSVLPKTVTIRQITGVVLQALQRTYAWPGHSDNARGVDAVNSRINPQTLQ
ncbi:MAG: response regulator [Planctomycetaceae bacterium]|nr:response regulator [Planctomycetaceae bacterium]